MILPTFNEEEILRELMQDWPAVMNKAKKLGTKLMKEITKNRVKVNRSIIGWDGEQHKTRNNNTWNVGVFSHPGAKNWWSVCFCEVENGYGKKSYYFLRGMNRPRKYFVEIQPHAIRRIRERCYDDENNLIYKDMPVREVLIWSIFEPRECGIFFKRGEFVDGKFQQQIDEDGNVNGYVLLKNAVFYARKTPHNNFIFKTYIKPEPRPGTKKFQFLHMVSLIHILFNDKNLKPKDYEKATNDLAKNILADSPDMLPYLLNSQEHFFTALFS